MASCSSSIPNLSPSVELVAEALEAHEDKAWAVVRRKYRAEMKHPDASHLLDTLAALSHQTAFSVGCYCEDESRCHRSVLRKLLAERGARIK